MKGYARCEAFSVFAIGAWERAVRLVERAPTFEPRANPISGLPRNTWVRCHELARAVAVIMVVTERIELAVRDGKYGSADHSWLLVCDGDRSEWPILDVYAPGSLPQVQLIDPSAGNTGRASMYVESNPREDIREDILIHLIGLMGAGDPRLLGGVLRERLAVK